MTPEQQRVQEFGERGREIEALRGLAGGVTATHLRVTELTEGAFDAVAEGLADPNPRIRWWCVQVLDHVPDRRALEAIARCSMIGYRAYAATPLMRSGASACKPDWTGGCLPESSRS